MLVRPTAQRVNIPAEMDQQGPCCRLVAAHDAHDLLQGRVLQGVLGSLKQRAKITHCYSGARYPVSVPVALKTRTERVETCVETHPMTLTCSVSRSLTSMMVYAGSLAATGVDPESLSDM